MAKVKIAIAIRSKAPVEVEPDVYRYSYEKVENIIADVRTKSYRFSDTQSVERNTSMSLTLSFIFANDTQDRINRISHVEYLGSVYKVDLVEFYSPRVNITPGSIETLSIDEIVEGDLDG